MNNQNRLQFLHCNQLFRSFDEIKNYVEAQDKFGDVPALFAEPTVFKYSDGVTTSDDNPNLVLAIGSNGSGTKNSTNNTFFIDITTVENKIASLSSTTGSEVDKLNDLEQLVKIVREDSIINLANSNSVEFVKVGSNESGKTYSANVKICEQADNIIEINDTDGIYAKADLTYDSATNTLSYTNSKKTTNIKLTQNQFFVSGYYSNQTDELVLEFTGTTGFNTIRIPVKGLIEEWTVDNTGHNVSLVKVVSNDIADDKLSADVNIANINHNILKSTEDGAALYVDGSADNIYYDTTYPTTKDKIESVINSNSLESARAQASEIALSGAIHSETDRATTVENAITNQVINNYNSALTKTQIETDNRILDVKRVEDLALNAISAETEQRKAAILTEVSDRNTAILESESRSAALVLNETDRAKNVENSISASTLNIINSINNTNTEIDNVNSSLTQSINSEILRATSAEQTLDDKIKENKVTVFDSKTINFTTVTTSNGTSVSGDVNIADIPSSNILRIGESGLYANPANLQYNPLTNELTFIDENGKEIKWTLAGTQVISSSTYIEGSRVLRLIFGNGSSVDIPLNGLIEEWITANSDTIALSKTYDSVQGKDILTATAKISSSSSNALTTSGNGLYVNNGASNFIYQDGSSNGITIQSAITDLNTRLENTNDTLSQDINKLSELSGKTITSITKNDSDTIELTITGDNNSKNIVANAKIALGETNAVKNENGLYVSNRADKLFIADGTSTIQNKLNSVDSQIKNYFQTTSAVSDDLTTKIDEIKTIEGQSGATYQRNLNYRYISGATNLNEADVLLNNAIVSQDLYDGRFTVISADTFGKKTVNLNLAIDSGSTYFSSNSLTFNDIKNNSTTSRFSASFGRSTSTKNISEMAVGECNISVKDNDDPSGQTIFTVGIGKVTETAVNGVVQETKEYANGLEIRKDGGIYIKKNPNDPSSSLTSLQDQLEIIDCGDY